MDPYKLKEGEFEIIRVVPPDIGDPLDMGNWTKVRYHKDKDNTVSCQSHSCPICETLGFNNSKEVSRFELMDLE